MPSTVSVKRKVIYERDGNKCLKCGSVENLTIDHIMPLSKGGNNSNNNLQTLCAECNMSKGIKFADYRADKSIPPPPMLTRAERKRKKKWVC